MGYGFNDRQKAIYLKIEKQVTIPQYFREVIFPLMDGYFDNEEPFQYRVFEKCPIHIEDSPSLKYFEGTNTFYCYACEKGGGVLQLHRAFMEAYNGSPVTPEEALVFLEKKFLRGGMQEVGKILSRKEADELNVAFEQTVASKDVSRKMSYWSLKMKDTASLIRNTVNKELKNMPQENITECLMSMSRVEKLAQTGEIEFEDAVEVIKTRFMEEYNRFKKEQQNVTN